MDEIYPPTNRETLEKWAEARPRGEGLKEGPMRIALALEHIAQALSHLRRPGVPSILEFSTAQPGFMCRECRRFVRGEANEDELCARCEAGKAER